ncbi:MAG TPA: NAD(P)H-hydrate epimerase, partial [Dehalococcoidia bacterium]|nr:NAD(P)H-hydrate epimerase [Dehalococcoidia bacterium]
MGPVHVIALDLPSSEQEQYKTTSESLQKRDERMAQTVQAILNENPENKIVTFTGNGHAGKSGYQMANLLANNGVDVVTVSINQRGTL